MYAQFFGLKQDPFSIAPDPRYLFMSERHREALAHLLYGLGAGGGFVLLSGEIGTGKTTVCRCFLEQIPANCNVAYIFNPKLTVNELLKSVCDEFHIAHGHPGPGVETVKDCLDPLNAFLLQAHAAGQNNVLIIDEAQSLSVEVLEQLRLLTNLETNERKLLQIILIGQPELRTMLATPELEQLAQRVIARFHLGALTPTETAQYIAHRLGVAGLHAANPFEPKALQRIHQLTGGVPRRINLLCDRALLGAYVHSSSAVTRAVVDKAAAEVFDRAPPSRTGTAASTPGPGRANLAWLGLGLLAGAALLGAWNLVYAPVNTARALASSAGQAKAATALAPASMAKAATPVASPAPVVAKPTLPAASAAAVTQAAPLPNPIRDVTDAWQALAPAWKLTLGDGDPCQAAARQQVQCFRIKSISLKLVRQMDRPGIVTLLGEDRKPVYALLIGLNDRSATLQTGDLTQLASPQSMDLATFTQRWTGDFSTFWTAPPGYLKPIADGNTGPAVDWLAAQLARLNGQPPPADKQVLDANWKAQVRAFQNAQGLRPNGTAGPTTLMQLNRAIGLDEPRLLTGNAR